MVSHNSPHRNGGFIRKLIKIWSLDSDSLTVDWPHFEQQSVKFHRKERGFHPVVRHFIRVDAKNLE